MPTPVLHVVPDPGGVPAGARLARLIRAAKSHDSLYARRERIALRGERSLDVTVGPRALSSHAPPPEELGALLDEFVECRQAGAFARARRASAELAKHGVRVLTLTLAGKAVRS